MFDSRFLYFVQTLLIAGTVLFFVRNQFRVLKIQVIIWGLGVIAIMFRFGTEGQLGFYSNDQLQYTAIVRILTTWEWAEGESVSLSWWTDFSKIPYPAAAVPLAFAGVHMALALKTVSLVSLLLLTRDLLTRYSSHSLVSQIRTAYLTGCGLIGTFFSLLALRETMMMYFVFRYFVARSPTGKLLAVSILFLLRSHLAAAVVMAEIVLGVWSFVSKRWKVGFADVPVLLVGGTTVGYSLFNLRFNSSQGYSLLQQLRTPFSGNFGIAETTQIASNYAGLQFLTAHEAFVRLSISELLSLRLIFSDTVLIPLGFSIAFIVFGYRLNRRHRLTVLVFTIYVSIVTNTDFNSFRQNIPLMPLMGMVILDFLKDRELRRRTSPEKLSDSSVESPASIGGVISSRIS